MSKTSIGTNGSYNGSSVDSMSGGSSTTIKHDTKDTTYTASVDHRGSSYSSGRQDDFGVRASVDHSFNKSVSVEVHGGYDKSGPSAGVSITIKK